ncbi:hypothetical protein IV102_09845 [bacterium]|nr:hypothetical protein [bacterium]
MQISTNPLGLARLSQAATFSAPPADTTPVDGVQLSPQASLAQRPTQAAQQMVTSLSEQLGDGIEGWQVYHVEKASFPFQVEKQARIGQERANRMIDSNQKHADRTLNRDSRLRSELRNALMDAGVAQPEISAADIKTLQDFFAARVGQKSNFYYSGTLCTVGWGSGDQESARGYPPNGPQTTTKILMNGAEAKILEVVKHYIA